MLLKYVIIYVAFLHIYSLLMTTTIQVAACPVVCSCFNTTVKCIGRDLDRLPTGLLENMTTL